MIADKEYNSKHVLYDFNSFLDVFMATFKRKNKLKK